MLPLIGQAQNILPGIEIGGNSRKTKIATPRVEINEEENALISGTF